VDRHDASGGEFLHTTVGTGSVKPRLRRICAGQSMHRSPPWPVSCVARSNASDAPTRAFSGSQPRNAQCTERTVVDHRNAPPCLATRIGDRGRRGASADDNDAYLVPDRRTCIRPRRSTLISAGFPVAMGSCQAA
jgi:hypothetical protein